MAADDVFEPLHHADQRTIRTIDSLTDAQWGEPSLLPGWSRAHVVAHLALNGEGFARALGGVQDGEPVAIYDSDETRDAAIVALAAEDVGEIRDRFYASTSTLRHLFGALTEEQWSATVNRLPEGPAWPVAYLLSARLREVEIHHADLGTAYSARDWPTDFSIDLLDTVAANHAVSESSGPFTAHATDVDRTWDAGAPSPVVSGTAGELAWWLVGRGGGQGLTSDHGPLPEIGPWARQVSRP